MRWSSVKRPSLLGLAILAALNLGSTMVHSERPRPEDESHAVRARVEAYERAWNTHDPKAVAASLTPDADMVMGNGPLIRGRGAIEEWWSTYFTRIDPKRGGTFAVDSIRLITPSVALVNVESRTGGHGSDPQELPVRLARGTWVMLRQGDEWLITALRGYPAEGDVRISPGRDR